MVERETSPSVQWGAVLTVGFGTAAAIWTLGYFSRLFELQSQTPHLVFTLICITAGMWLAAQGVGGYLMGRRSTSGIRGGLLAGLLTGLLNLFVVASLISTDQPNRIQFSALIWIPACLLACGIVGAGGAWVGRWRRPQGASVQDWGGGLPIVAAVATFILLAIGGFVTGADEGLAVVDWPNTETYNMFLYPLERMTGGIFLEHAHRLFGSLVGLTAFVTALYVTFTERRRWVTAFAWIALICVAGQGVLGGLRVTGVLTLSDNPADTRPNIILAVVHGVFGQIVFGAFVLLACARARIWRQAGPAILSPTAGTDRVFQVGLLLLVVVQLVLGAIVRHFTWALRMLRYGVDVPPDQLIAQGKWALHLHITLAVVVALVAVAVGVRAWGFYRQYAVFRRLGTSLMILVGLQITLGVLSLIVTGDDSPANKPPLMDMLITTGHQVIGAAVLAWAVMLYAWNRRLLTPEPTVRRRVGRV